MKDLEIEGFKIRDSEIKNSKIEVRNQRSKSKLSELLLSYFWETNTVWYVFDECHDFHTFFIVDAYHHG